MRKNWWLYLVVVVLCVVGLIASGCAKPAPEEEKDGLPITPEEEEEEKWVPLVAGMKEGEEDLYFNWQCGITSRDVPGSQYYRFWAEEIEKRSKGRMKLTIQWGGTLGRRPELPFLAGAGVFELCQYSTLYFHRETPIDVILNMPFFSSWTDDWERKEVWRQIHELCTLPTLHPIAQKDVGTMNLRNLFQFTQYAPYMFYTRKGKVLDEMSDWEGMLMRAPGYLASWARAMGAIPVSSAQVPNAYEAFLKGMLDITLVPPASIMTMDLPEVMEGILWWGTNRGQFPTAVNLDAWERLPQYLKDLNQDLFDGDMIDFDIDANWEDFANIKAFINESGVTYFELKPGEQEKIEAAALASYVEWEEHCTAIGRYAEWKEYFEYCIALRNQWSKDLGESVEWDIYLP